MIMKKILILVILISAIFPACSKAALIKHDQEAESKDCLVTFNPVGEIESSVSPLGKAHILTDDIFLVQVYKGSEKFALGYFDNLESMQLCLKQGASYRIIVAMVKNAKNLLGTRFNLQQNSICNNKANDSFNFTYRQQTGSTSYKTYNSSTLSYYYPLNRYQYAFNNYFEYYSSSTAATLSQFSFSSGSYGDNNGVLYFYFTGIEHTCLDGVDYPACTDWFYGEVSDYTPDGDYETLDLSFKRVGFKLKYELSGVTDGEVTVRVYNNTRTFIENTTVTPSYSSDTQFIAFYDARSAWQYADDYSENMDVAVVWKRGIGVTQDLGRKTVQVKRNCLNNIKIVLGSDDRGAGVSMSMEPESSMGNLNTDIPVQ